MNIIVDISCEKAGMAESQIIALVTHVLQQEGAPDTCEVSISLITIDEIAQLNSTYRGKEGPTDVLSFPCEDAWEAADDPEVILGDIMISPEVCAAQAPEYGNTTEEEMSLLLVHGCLHLLGYDHIEDKEAEEMEAHERDILASWKAGQ